MTLPRTQRLEAPTIAMDTVDATLALTDTVPPVAELDLNLNHTQPAPGRFAELFPDDTGSDSAVSDADRQDEVSLRQVDAVNGINGHIWVMEVEPAGYADKVAHSKALEEKNAAEAASGEQKKAPKKALSREDFTALCMRAMRGELSSPDVQAEVPVQPETPVIAEKSTTLEPVIQPIAEAPTAPRITWTSRIINRARELAVTHDIDKRTMAVIGVALIALPVALQSMAGAGGSDKIAAKSSIAYEAKSPNLKLAAGAEKQPIAPKFEFETTTSTAVTAVAAPIAVAETTAVPLAEIVRATVEANEAKIVAEKTAAAEVTKVEIAKAAEKKAEQKGRSVEEVFESLCGSSTVNSEYGPRWGKLHGGTDLNCVGGAEIRAFKSGTVTYSDWLGAYGNMVEVDHGNGLKTRYAHARSLKVSVGQVVDQNTVLGLVGSTGESTGNHLHFETRVDGELLNPRNVIPRYES